jgi:nicotinate phosphoribosyltransferase
MNPEPPVSLWPDPDALGAVTDLYQLTMMAGYEASRKTRQRATFEVFVRKMPPHRAFLVFAGLEQAIGDLLRLAFTREHAEALRRWPMFAHVDPSFFDWLPSLRFRGDVWAIPEGTVVFPGEPLLRVEAPLEQAQWVETFLLASLGYPTCVASKAARIVAAAVGRPVYDFGARRAPGPYAGLVAARAAYLAGCAGTSHVEAALRLGIPCVGTMAHSWVQSFETETAAFEAFASVYPETSTLLVDTYSTAAGVMHAAAMEPEVQGVRLDSGDLDDLSRGARTYLDTHNRAGVRVFASGDLDEWTIARLVSAGAPIDAFGVGTEMATSRDAPALSIVYKLVALDGAGRVKLSPGKATYPLAKQVYRQHATDGTLAGDLVAGADEPAEGEPLLVQVVRDGKLAAPLPRLDALQRRALEQVATLPASLRTLDAEPRELVSFSAALRAEADRIAARS